MAFTLLFLGAVLLFELIRAPHTWHRALLMLPARSIQAVGFDLDNTLIDRDGTLLRLLHSWLKEISRAVTPHEVEELLTLDAHGHGNRDAFFRRLAELLRTDPGLLRERFMQEFPLHFKSDPASDQLLRLLQKRSIPIALLTNGGSVVQRAKLRASGLAEFFSAAAILISQEIGWEKPQREAFDLLSEVLGVAAESILFVGDHKEKDIAGARSAGMRTAWVRRNCTEEVQADFIVRQSVAELADFLCL